MCQSMPASTGHNDGDGERLRGRAGLQWQQDKPSAPHKSFKEQWDALPPLQEFRSGGRARSLQAPSLAQGMAVALPVVDLVCWLAPSRGVAGSADRTLSIALPLASRKVVRTGDMLCQRSGNGGEPRLRSSQ